MKISTVISFSSIESKFFAPLVTEIERFCDDIIVVAHDHFFNGQPENLALMKELEAQHPQTKWIILPWHSSLESRLCHNNARWAGALVAKNSHVLFIDADEIPDGFLMKRWLENEPLNEYPLHTFACYWYFRDPKFQAKKLEHCGLLADMTKLKKEMFFTELERWIFMKYPVETKKYCMLNGNVIFNHYSWVRTKEEMLAKVTSWGHKNDADWVKRVEEEFMHEFSGKDFVHGYSYNTVLNIFNIKV